MTHHDDSWNNGYAAGLESGKYANAEEVRKLQEQLATVRELNDCLKKREAELLEANNRYQQDARDWRERYQHQKQLARSISEKLGDIRGEITSLYRRLV
jgi:dsDNA-specific endonuclease/ATPase MutS2